MSEFIYQTLASIGYHHPLHPAITHLPVGLVFGGFLFGLGAFLLRQDTMAHTAHHCMILALITLIPTVVLGYFDWHQFYGGAPILAIKMKFVLALVLLILLLVAVYFGVKAPKGMKTMLVYGLSVISVIGLGYFGGELVFGKREPVAETVGAEDSLPAGVKAGSLAFGQLCSGCHHRDRSDFKAGPGLKGLFLKDKLYGSDWPVTEANVRKQIVEPYGTMPAYRDMSEKELADMIAYLKTL